ncbi:MAG: hybrid sensor histidine kinase/response regulator [Phycisphaerales bacterium]|nr:hybrid sensor histidine kinase/response regulator [Phycisphaerales bacterium]
MAHVLVVEDEKDSRDFVAQYLKREGHTVTTAVDGQTALRKLLNERADIVVLDVRMPNMDGIGLLEILRSYLRWNTLPVILFTARAIPEELTRARDMGVEHIFHKANFQLAELGQVVMDICHPNDGGTDTIAG